MSLTKVQFQNINTNVVAFSDPITVTNFGNVGNRDIGEIFDRSQGSASNVTIIWQESTKSFRLGYTSDTGKQAANVTITGNANLRVGNLYAESISWANGAAFTSSQPGAGTSGQLQYNNAGQFGSATGLTTDGAGTLNAVTLQAATIGNTGATLTGTISTAAQSNITSVGTLTGLSLSGTLNGTILQATTIGNVGAGLLGANITGLNSLQGPVGVYGANTGSFSTTTTTGNATAAALTVNGTATVGSTLSASGGIQNTAIGNLSQNSGAFTSLIAYAGLNNTIIGNVTPSSATFTSLSTSGNATVGNLSTAGNVTAAYFFGNGSQLTGIASGNYGNVQMLANLAAKSNPITFGSNITIAANGISIGNTTIGSTILGNGIMNINAGLGMNINSGLGWPATLKAGDDDGSNGAGSVYLIAGTDFGTGIPGNAYLKGVSTYIQTLAGATLLTVSGVNTDINLTTGTGGAVQVTGGTRLSSNLWIGGAAKVASNTTSVSATTGALLVAGGVGISGNLNVAGNVNATYFFGNGSQLTGIAPGNYSNANVASYLPTYTGNLTPGNLTVSGTTSFTGNILGNTTFISNVIAGAFFFANGTAVGTGGGGGGGGATNPSLYNGIATNVTTATTLIDSLSITGNTTITYTFSAIDNANGRFKTSKLDTVNDGTNVYYSEYAVVRNNTNYNVAVITSNISGGQLRIYAQGDSANTTVTFQRIVLGSVTSAGYINSGAAGSLNYVASTTAPSNPKVGDQWYNTTLDILYEYQNVGTGTFWIDTSSLTLPGPNPVSTNPDSLSPFLLMGA